jgi:inorganic triphosphatase YgiF
VIDGEEVELKLQLSLEDIAILVASPPFSDQEPVCRDQHSIYFDTGANALHAAGLSLRIRSTSGERIQTIKT